MKSKVIFAGLMASAAFFTLLGYELMRSSATVLFKAAYGAERLPWVMACMPVVVLLGVWGYGQLLSRFGPRLTLQICSYASATLMVLGFALLKLEMIWVTPLLFLLKEFYVVLLIEQYWSYINSELDASSAKKLNGPITGIAGTGGVIGGILVAQLAIPLGTHALVLLAALVLLPSAWIANYAYRRFGEPALTTDEPPKSLGEGIGWESVQRNPKLLSLLFIVIASQVTAAVLDFKFQLILSDAFVGRIDEETAFQGQFWFVLNLVTVLVQFVVTPFLLTWVALRWVHLMMPALHCCTIAWAVIEPTLFSVGLAFFLFKVFDYSVFRGAKELVYLPLGFDARYRAKEFIDVFGYRTSKGGSSLVVTVLQNLGVLMSSYYLFIALALAGLWSFLVFPLTRPEKAIEER
ncbi:MAG: Npt1/Npt2 family nucleotide transporter [Pseudomonadales bacterium]